MQKVVVYTSPTCTYCHLVKIFLKKNKVEFEEVDISEDQAGEQALVEKAGLSQVPVTFVGEEIVRGFDKKKLKELLGI